MVNFHRDIQKQIENKLFKHKVIILYGARQVGKTTIIKKILEKNNLHSAYFDCEDPGVRDSFENANILQLKSLLVDLKFIIFDEAQKIKNIGQTLKLIHDHLPKIQIIASGSSSFDLANKIVEPLTGRKYEFVLYPISITELLKIYNRVEVKNFLSLILRFGNYPDILKSSELQKPEILKELTKSYLFKDIFIFQDLRNPELLQKLLQNLALQIGQEVSYHELGVKLGVNEATISRYIDLLEKAFVIFKLSALSQNPRTEIHKKKKIYFYDLGIRNAIIQNFNNLELRNDIGAMWENFCIIERKKFLSKLQKTPNQYFWRTYSQSEIDYIEEENGNFYPYEFKWNTKKKFKLPKSFSEKYQYKNFKIISPDNFFDFVC